MQVELEGVITLDGLRVTGRRGWGLIRASNTEPALVLRAEAATREGVEQLLTFLKTQMMIVQQGLGIAF
jgi:phosphomannomutase